ncbi:MAG: phospholipase D-like domain-containing protein [Vicinamibacterales bacterium]
MRLFLKLLPLFVVALVATAPRADALERICDVAHEDCRAPLLTLIENETVGIDVSFWFMQDSRYSSRLIQRWNAGVPVRVLMDTQANCCYAGNAEILDQLKAAGIPIREKTSSEGILHWKLMLFAGQNTVQFSGANYSDEAFVPITPYANYVDEVIYFTDNPSYVASFKSRYDDAWTDTVKFTNWANITGPLVRNYGPPLATLDPEINWVPWQNFANRSTGRYNAEKLDVYPDAAIDAVMYRITDRRHTDSLIAAIGRGIPVRLISEPLQYRDPTRLWHSWNVDRLYMAGAQVRHRSHAGLNHEKLTILHGQDMTIFGSSNWTSASATGQHEHNLFTTSQSWYLWAVDHFNRKWNNSAPGGIEETEPFVPLPPDAPVIKNPLNGAQDQPTAVTLRWNAGPWAHKYDLYFGTDPSNLEKIVDDQELGPSQTTSDHKSWAVSDLAEGTTYYWRVVSRTMANMEAAGPTWSFRTSGAPPAVGANDVVLWAWRATTKPGWSVVSDSSGAGGKRLSNPNLNAPSASPAAEPAAYFDLGFEAAAGVPYRLWIRGKATSNAWPNDSVWVQFSDSVTAGGGPQWRTGSTDAVRVQIEECANCGLADWGWNDTASSGAGDLGPVVYFAETGPKTIRVQVREDGLSIDQVILSRDVFLNTAPGQPKSDGMIYPEQGGSSLPPPPPPPPGGNLPEGWSTSDIGSVGVAGSATQNSGQFTLQGSGTDIWGTADAFRYAYTPLDGDGSIVALVSSVSNTDAWTKAGVMIRGTLSSGSAHAAMFVSAGKGLAFQRRAADGGVSTHTAGPSSTAPYWVKIERSGSTITASRSTDGTTWHIVGTDTIALPATAYVGLALTSHNNSALATATFAAVSITTVSGGGDPPPPPPPPPGLPTGWAFTDIGSVGAAGSGSESGGTFTVKGAGADTWGSADAFGFAHTTLTGNGEMVARVATVQNISSWTKVGVMFRDGLTTGAAHGFAIVTPSTVKGTAFQRRVTAGGASTHTAGPAVAPPYWVKLARAGDIFTASVSPDGVTWTVVGSDTIVMGSTINVGLAVSSHVAGTLATATFDSVAITPVP